MLRLKLSFPLLFSTLLSILTSAISYGQGSPIYGNPSTNEFVYGICADDSGNSYIGGITGNNALLTKLDVANNIIWNKTFQFSLNAGHESVITYVDQIGDTIFGCGWIESGSTHIGSAYFKINATTGVPYWIKSEITSNLYFSSMSYENGRYFLVGSQSVNGKVVCVSSSTGNLIWETNSMAILFAPGINYVDDFLGATKMINGKMFITGRSYINGAGNFDMRPLLIGVNDIGNIFLQKYLVINEFDPGIDRYYGMAISYHDSSSIVVSYFGDDNYTGVSDYKVGMTKLDLQGNVQFTKTYDIAGVSNEIVKSINVSDDSYVLFGYVNHGSANPKLFAIKTDTNGVFQKANLYGSSIGTFLTLHGPLNIGGGSEFYNGTHYFCASHHTGNQNLRNAAQILLDSDLNTSSACILQDSVNVTTSTLVPFSGNVVIQNYSPSYNPQPSSSTNNLVFSNSCSQDTVAFNLTQGCDTTWVTASVNGFSNPQYIWSNGALTATTYSTINETLFVIVSDAGSCCTVEDSIVLSTSVSFLQVQLPSDSVFCLNFGDTYTIIPSVLGTNGNEVYTWNTGALTSNLDVNLSGTYTLTVSNSCTSVEDTINLVINNFLQNADIADTSVCSSEFPLVLNSPFANFDSLNWSTGAVTSIESFSSPGIYNVIASNMCGSVEDTFEIIQLPTPDVSTINDIDTCINQGAFIYLQASNYTSNFPVWSDGSTNNSFDISTSGNYSLVGWNTCGTDTSNFVVTINEFLESDNFPDTSICLGAFPFSVSTQIGNYDSLVWSTGSISPSISVLNPGAYSLTAYNQCGFVTDTFVIITMPLPIVSPISDIDTCLEIGGFVSLDASDYTSEPATWSNGSQNNTITISNSGQFYLVANNSCGVDSSNFEVTINHIPYLDLPTIIDTCLTNGGILVDAYTVNGAYNWSTGSSEQEVLIETPGIYYCTLVTLCGIVSDSIVVNNETDLILLAPDTINICTDKVRINDINYQSTGTSVYLSSSPLGYDIGNINESGDYYITSSDDCGTISLPIYINIDNSTLFYSPNSFTPDGDEHNNIYKFEGENFRVREVRIFNRWGQLIYEEYDQFTGWDGTLNGEFCQDGIYVVSVVYEDCSSLVVLKNLHVVLIR